jgi:uncharacterized protein (DUF58 family)
MAAPLQEIVYRSRQPVRGLRPGRHRSAGGPDGGFEFRAHVLLQDAPDVRRLDLQASLRDPFGRWLVRSHLPRLALPVWLLADLSASMAFQGGVARMAVLADLCASLAWSAWKSGDRFGLLGCAETVLPGWTQWPTHDRGAGFAWAERLRVATPVGASALGLQQAAPLLGRQRGLVFVVSDFQGPLAQHERLLASLAAHELVLVALGRPAEADLGRRPGLALLHDAETGRQQLRWWRPGLRQQWAAAWQAQRSALQALARRHQRPCVFMDQGFQAQALNQVFQA